MNYDYWYNYRLELTKRINENNNIKNYNNEDEKRKDIVKMANNIGIKPTARYFKISPSCVRYWIKKYKG